MKILLAVDGSSYTKKMLAYVTTHSDLFTAQNDFTVLTMRPSFPDRAIKVVGKGVVDEYHVEEAEKIIAPVTKFLLRHGINAKSSWKAGDVGAGIARFAESQKFDLVVMGSHGHGAIASLVMGSVATQVLAHCKVPLLLVR